MRRILVVLAIVLVPALGACGSDDGPAAPAVPRQAETVDELPKLPRGFEPYVSRINGIAFGRPPGWQVKRRGVATLLEAPDRLVVMSISADRSNEALMGDPRTFAVQTFSALEGYEGELDPSEPQRFRHRYNAFEVKGRGVAADSGVRQRMRLIVLEREGAAVVTAVIAENADVGAPGEVRQALQALRTLRTRPVG